MAPPPPAPEKPAPPRVTIAGRVLDAAGVPVPGARVLAYGGRDATGVEVAADDAGRFRVAVEPRPWILVAFARECGPPVAGDGYAADGTAVAPAAGQDIEGVEVRLPFALADLGKVSLVVRDRRGQPLPGVLAYFEGYAHAADGEAQGGFTDEEGRASFANLLPGTRIVRIEGTRAFLPVRLTVDLPPGATVTAEATLDGRSSRALPPLIVRCEDGDGRGIADADIRMSGASPEDFHERFLTGPEGEVVVEGLPAPAESSKYHAFAFKSGYETASGFLPAYDPGGGPYRWILRLAPRSERTAEPPARPVPATLLHGVVLDSAGRPVEGAGVSWSREEGDPDRDLAVHAFEAATSNLHGRFVATGLPPGPLFLRARHHRLAFHRFKGVATRVDLVEGALTEVELRLPFALGDLARLECRVVDEAGSPRVGVSVTSDKCVGVEVTAESSLSRPDGRLTLSVLPGSLDVRAWETPTHLGAHRQVEVPPGSRQEVELVTPARTGGRSLSLSAEAVDDAGVALAGCQILLSTDEGRVDEGRTDASGRCAFPALPDSLRTRELHVSAFPPDNDWTGFALAYAFPAWAEDGRAHVRLVLERKVRFRLRIRDEATGDPIRDSRYSLRASNGEGSDSHCYLSDDEAGKEESAVPGTIHLGASAPGYEERWWKAVLSRGEDGGVLELLLRREAPPAPSPPPPA
jgi:hypothetical protein